MAEEGGVRVVPVLAFREREMNPLDEPIFRLPFVTLSPRQLFYTIFFGSLALILARPLPSPGMQVVVFLSVFVLGTFLMGRPAKTVSNEYIILRFLRQVLPGRKVRKVKLPPPKRASAPMRVEVEEPVKLTGRLVVGGIPLAKSEVEVLVDGRPHGRLFTDKEGWYSYLLIPPGAGKYVVSMRPKNSNEVVEEFTLVVGRASPPANPGGKGERKEEVGEARKEEKLKYAYELIPSNFLTLPKDLKDALVDQFRSFLNSLEREVKIYAIRTTEEVTIMGEKKEISYYKFYAESEVPLDQNLSVAGMEFRRTVRVPRPVVVGERGKVVVMEGGTLATTLTVYSVPFELAEGFLSELYGVADEVKVRIHPFSPEVAAVKAKKFARRMGAFLLMEAERTRLPDSERRMRRERAEAMYLSIMRGNTRLFRFIVNVTVTGKSGAELKEKMRMVKSILMRRGVRVDRPPFQSECLEAEQGCWIVGTTEVAGCLYPFVSADVLDPGGLFLGVNMFTGAPVIYDPFARMNYNISIIGVPGAGKSFAAKLLLKRAKERYPDLAYWVIDPTGEYCPPVWSLGGSVEFLDRKSPLGLDPFALFSDESEAVNFLKAAFPKMAEYGAELEVAAQGCRSLRDLWKRLPRRSPLKKEVEALLKGTSGYIFSGKPLRFPEEASINLFPLRAGLVGVGEGDRELQVVCLLIFTKIWKSILEMPRSRPKMVIVDEAWLFSKLSFAAAFLEQVARMGRKHNVSLVIATQQPKDVLSSAPLARAMESSATKIILKQEMGEEAVDKVRSTFSLSREETDLLLKAEPGQGLLLAPGVRAALQFTPVSEEEYDLFTTRPTEMMG
ncbi:MAG: ATP-binding protein [Candidatus Hadarchaeales archaeon]